MPPRRNHVLAPAQIAFRAAVLIGLGADFGNLATWSHSSGMPFVTNLAALSESPAFQALPSPHVLLNTAAPTALEAADGNWAAVLRFPSMDAAKAWYDSPEYRPLRQLRIDELTEPGGRILLLGAFDPAGG